MKATILLYSILITFVGIFGAFIAPRTFSTNFLFANGLIAFLSYGISLCYSRLVFKDFSWVSLFTLFSLSFVIIHFQYPFLVRFYPDIEGLMFVWMRPEYTAKASSVSLAGYGAFLFGYFIQKPKLPPLLINKLVATMRLGPLNSATYLITFVAIGTLGVIFVIDPEFYLAGSYGSNQGEAIASGLSHFLLLFKAFYASSIVLDIYRLRLEHNRLNPFEFVFASNKLVLALVSVFLLLSFYVGDRGPIIQTLALYGAAYSIFFLRIRLYQFLTIALVGALFMGFISKFRTREDGLSLALRMEEGKYEFQDSKWYDIPGELGSNVRVLHVALPMADQTGYFWGLFKLNNIVSAVPFASRLVSKALGPYMSGLSSSHYLTAVIIGPYSRIGVGTTIIADIYLDFGLFGCVILMGLLGGGFAWIENRGFYTKSLYSHTLFMMCAGFAFYWPRSSYITNIKEITWTLLLIFVIHRVLTSNLRLPNNSLSFKGKT